METDPVSRNAVFCGVSDDGQSRKPLFHIPVISRENGLAWLGA
jgi:hypothetical protein